LAAAAKLPQPNLKNSECGKREKAPDILYLILITSINTKTFWKVPKGFCVLNVEMFISVEIISYIASLQV
jgi:hypothetical protein